MKKLIKTSLAILFSFSLYQCGSDELQLTTDLVQSIRIWDIGNEQNASDLFAVFTIDDPSQVQEIRLFIIPSGDYASFDAQKAKNLDNGSFHIVEVNNSDYQIQLPSNLKDINSNTIQENVEYTFAIGLMMNENLLMNENIDQITLANKHFLEGRYTGTWNDNLYVDFGISAELKFQAGKLRGDFFYSSNFTSCCSGENDGMITLEIDENVILSYEYNQVLDSFMGGECTGLYIGNGVVEDFLRLKIDFTGDDCEGPHFGGAIVFNKIE